MAQSLCAIWQFDALAHRGGLGSGLLLELMYPGGSVRRNQALHFELLLHTRHHTGSAETQAGRAVAQPKPRSRRSHPEVVRGATVEVWKNRQRAWRWARHLRCAVEFRCRRQARFQLSHAPSLSLARLDEVVSLLHQLADV